MILYNITINIDEDAQSDWLGWMKESHIPDVMSTGLFVECKMARILAEEAGGLSYSVQFFAKNMADYDKYISEHADRLRNESEKNFGGKMVAFRTLLEIIHQVDGLR